MSERLSQFDKALLGLRSLVLSGEFTGQRRLSEVAFAERLGISRTPLRQAMDRLVAEGLLERIETGGCRVATFTPDDIADAIELRGVVEGTAARMAAERGVAEPLLADAAEVLDRIDGALRASGGVDFDEYIQANARFHDLLARFADSPILRREIERMSLLPLASPSAFSERTISDSGFSGLADLCPTPAPGHSGCDHQPRRRAGRSADPRTCASCAEQFHLPHRTATDARQAGAGAGIGGLRITGTETKK